MFNVQIGIICLVIIVFSKLVLDVFRGFEMKIRYSRCLLFPLWLFGFGFSFRLTSNKSLIDLGYFLTDFSTLFVTVLFTVFLFLGQLKYWRK